MGRTEGSFFLGSIGTYFLQGVEQERKSYSKCVLKLYPFFKKSVYYMFVICVLFCLFFLMLSTFTF